MDVDTAVRHRLPMAIICGNNGIWGLEKHPMQQLYGYDVAAVKSPQCTQVYRSKNDPGRGHGFHERCATPTKIGKTLTKSSPDSKPIIGLKTQPSSTWSTRPGPVPPGPRRHVRPY